jgi:hypothetical protein
MQHAPVGVGAGQVVVVQTVFAPFHTPLSFTQLACARTEQLVAPAELVMQHAPVTTGGGQVVCVHAEFTPFHTPPEEAHCASLTIAHQSAVTLL